MLEELSFDSWYDGPICEKCGAYEHNGHMEECDRLKLINGLKGMVTIWKALKKP